MIYPISKVKWRGKEYNLDTRLQQCICTTNDQDVIAFDDLMPNLIDEVLHTLIEDTFFVEV